MTTDRVEALTALLAETGAAHGLHEETELHGVYDEAWPDWYAAYAVDHGIGDLVGRPITAGELAAYFRSSNAELEATMPRPDEPWAAYTARRISLEL